MIHYQLTCEAAHAFDGWFRDSAAFTSQQAAGLVECPECGSARVNRALMSPAIGRRGKVVDQAGREEAAVSAPPAAPAPAAMVEAAGMPDQVRAVLQRLRAEVESKCEHVGNRFAEEARAIHHGEAVSRGIFGETTPEQAEALAEEGIEVSRIPWVPRADG